MMAVEINNGVSVENAVREVVRSGPPASARLLSEAVMDADTRRNPDIKASVYTILARLPEECGPYASALRMVLQASDTRDGSERARLIDEARRESLTGLRDAGKRFSASLNMPFLLIFGIGIMVPMVLMSVLPMLSVSGIFGTASLDPAALAAAVLVAIPAVLMFTVAEIRRRNPFGRPMEFSVDMRQAAALGC